MNTGSAWRLATLAALLPIVAGSARDVRAPDWSALEPETMQHFQTLARSPCRR
jgi:hypothetical protein